MSNSGDLSISQHAPAINPTSSVLPTYLSCAYLPTSDFLLFIVSVLCVLDSSMLFALLDIYRWINNDQKLYKFLSNSLLQFYLFYNFDQ